MSGATSPCPHRDDAGPWVLGALDEQDARAFAMHLETGCDACRAEVAALQPVADVLPMAAPQQVPPPQLKGRLMAVVNAEAELLRAAGPEADRPPERARSAGRRRRGGLGALLRPLPATVLAVALLALGVAAGVLLTDDGDVTAHPGFGPRGTQVALRVDDAGHGELDLRGMPAAPAGRVYQVWLVTGTEKPRPTHTLFTVPDDGRARVKIPESLKGTDQVLVTAEPAGGSRQPTTSPVVGAELA
jgi:anti-sigma-K factor RskA